mmetsp:Transcript_16723/g.26724  ORF Transcript_16723/g.26724 Transcript_16723/m.26724 type:complete len:215 (+) Transcript_16723:495-1139(+)
MTMSTGASNSAASLATDALSCTSTPLIICTPRPSRAGLGPRHVTMALAPCATSSLVMLKPRPRDAPTTRTRLPLSQDPSKTVSMSRNRWFPSFLARSKRATWSGRLYCRSPGASSTAGSALASFAVRTDQPKATKRPAAKEYRRSKDSASPPPRRRSSAPPRAGRPVKSEAPRRAPIRGVVCEMLALGPCANVLPQPQAWPTAAAPAAAKATLA